jgi:kinesin family protein 4/21/27
MTELSLHAPDDVLRFFAAIACRNTAGTDLNDSSSRSHCFVFLTLYACNATARTVRTSRFQFVDLAGSERIKDAHRALAGFSGDKSAIEGVFTNYSLIILSQRIRELVAARRKGKTAEDLVQQSFRTQCDPDLLPLLAESLTGVALSLIVVCVSSAPDNSSQSKNTLDFGEVFSHLAVFPREMPAVLLDRLVARAQGLIQSGQQAGGSGKYATIRSAQGRAGDRLLAVIEKLTG